MKLLRLSILFAAACAVSSAGILARLPSGGPAHGLTRMICHRTANRDMPENTLESLALAARMGCLVVEVDLRFTLDREIVLNHDGLLERLTNGVGEVETSYFDELALLDAGSWMGTRFSGLKIPRFLDALHLADEHQIGLNLDLKDKGMAATLLPLLRHAGMLEKVRFGGEWDDVRSAYPAANEDAVVSLDPPVTPQMVEQKHRLGKSVIANFSANAHEMDLAGMRAAVAAGVDWINVDFPRLGADAIGQPVESKLAALRTQAETGPLSDRAPAILELSHYVGFPLQSSFEHWLLNGDAAVSHAAALALLSARPATPLPVFLSALHATQQPARQNAAWALGMRAAPAAASLIPLLSEQSPVVLQEALLAMSRCPGEVPASRLLPFLSHPSPLIRGSAALALARHQPAVAAQVLPKILAKEEAFVANQYGSAVQTGKRRLSQSEIAVTIQLYRGLMKMIQSGVFLTDPQALSFFSQQAFRSADDFSAATAGPVAGFQLWDRLAANPAPAILALASSDIQVANRAEWALVNAGPSALPSVRQALGSPDRTVRERAVRILAWQADAASLPALDSLAASNRADAALVHWAVEKIHAFAR